MDVVPEKVFVQPNVEAAQLVVVMEGFRLTLSKRESEALRDGLSQGLKQLDLTPAEPRRPALMGVADNEARLEPRRIGSTSP
ncbi:MAG: hypothetical protein ACLQJR_04505 [Stellaceae bacterium]